MIFKQGRLTYIIGQYVNMNALDEFLSSKVKAGLCRRLFGTSDEELHLRELARRSGYSFSSVQREIEKLSRLGIVTRRVDGNRRILAIENPVRCRTPGARWTLSPHGIRIVPSI